MRHTGAVRYRQMIETRAAASTPTLEVRARVGEARAVEIEGQPGVTLHLITPGVVDDWGSLWMPNTFDESLSKRLPVLCWAHDWGEPLGHGVDHRTTKNGPDVDFVFDDFDAVPMARRAYAQVKSGTITDCSVGFSDTQRRDPTDAEERKYPGIREIIEQSTCDETSLVLRGAVPGAVVTGIRAAAGALDWPLAARDTLWDPAGARGRLQAWAGVDADSPSVAAWEKYRSVHFACDPSRADSIAGYKLPFCDIIEGRCVAVPAAITAAASELPADAAAEVRKTIGGYCTRAADTFNDSSLSAPWETRSRSGLTLVRMGAGTVSEDLAISLAKRVVAGELTQEEAAVVLALTAIPDDPAAQPVPKTQEELDADAAAATSAVDDVLAVADDVIGQLDAVGL